MLSNSISIGGPGLLVGGWSPDRVRGPCGCPRSAAIHHRGQPPLV